MTRNAFSEFLAQVQARAFKWAGYELSDEQEALDAVQEAFVKLAEKYGDKPAEELAPLFWMILRNKITDKQRRGKIRRMREVLFSAFGSGEDGDEQDPLEFLQADDGQKSQEYRSAKVRVMGALDEELRKLPARQREAFLLRHLEGLDLAQTALAMGCTEGSVKTHTHRAMQGLREGLEKRGIGLGDLDL